MAIGKNFSFRGINISQYNCYYMPDNTNNDWHRWDSNYKVIDKTLEAADGGQWYGSVVSPKLFTLKCYFENASENDILFIESLFFNKSVGDLVFDERPWLTYVARPTKQPVVAKYPTGGGLFSGTITITLTAYYPFATMSLQTLDDALAQMPNNYDRIESLTGLLLDSRMPENQVISVASPADLQFTYTAYNAGNERADTVIRIAGDALDGVTIYNAENDQHCKILGITKALTTDDGKWIEVHSKTGEVFLTNGSTNWNGFYYHDNGYIQLLPSCPVIRGVESSYENNGITFDVPILDPNKVGWSTYVAGAWHRIGTVLSPVSAFVDETFSSAGTGPADVARANRIIVTPESTMSLTRFEVVHSHTFS